MTLIRSTAPVLRCITAAIGALVSFGVVLRARLEAPHIILGIALALGVSAAAQVFTPRSHPLRHTAGVTVGTAFLWLWLGSVVNRELPVTVWEGLLNAVLLSAIGAPLVLLVALPGWLAFLVLDSAVCRFFASETFWSEEHGRPGSEPVRQDTRRAS